MHIPLHSAIMHDAYSDPYHLHKSGFLSVNTSNAPLNRRGWLTPRYWKNSQVTRH